MTTLKCDSVNLSTVHSWLQRQSISAESGSTVVTYTHDLGHSPVLWLVHGYPQSAFIFRHVSIQKSKQFLCLPFALSVQFIPVKNLVPNPFKKCCVVLTVHCMSFNHVCCAHSLQLAPILKDKISLFVPEMPGYGISTSPDNASGFRAIGASLIQAFQKLFPNRAVILGGHDRGARLCHRLAVDNTHPPSSSPGAPFHLLGIMLLDIVPTLRQWEVFAKPEASTAYFHWPFLASPLATDMIDAYGGDKWTHSALERIAGSSEAGLKRFKANDAWEVYESLFSKRETIEGSCRDYHAGCYEEPAMQTKDQEEGRKLGVPVLVMWSLARLGKMHGDVGAIWKDWVKDQAKLKVVGCGNDVGHYLPEEATDIVSEHLVRFIQDVTK